MNAKRTTTIAISGTTSSFQLDDLRYLINETSHLKGDHTVELRVDNPPSYHPTDHGSSWLTVEFTADDRAQAIRKAFEAPSERSARVTPRAGGTSLIETSAEAEDAQRAFEAAHGTCGPIPGCSDPRHSWNQR